jgi:hypothetical protein
VISIPELHCSAESFAFLPKDQLVRLDIFQRVDLATEFRDIGRGVASLRSQARLRPKMD